jgi:hypothetical protein
MHGTSAADQRTVNKTPSSLTGRQLRFRRGRSAPLVDDDGVQVAPSGAAAFPRMAQRPRHNSRTERWLITSWSVAGTTGWSPPVACVEELELRAAGLAYREMDPFSIAVHRDGAIRNPSNEWAPACFNAAVPPTKMRR